MFIRLHRDDEGYALLLTIGIASVLSILLTTVFAVTIREQRSSTTDRDRQAALAAANAAVDDYLFRINRDSDYWIYNTTDPNPDPENPAFTQWVDVPGEPTSPQPQFRYASVDTSQLAATGNIYLTAEGRVNGEVRQVQTQLRRLNFLNYLYFTEYETLSPLVYPESGSGMTRSRAENVCRRHLYDSPPRDSDCVQIYWATGDSVEGPFHTNDRWAVDGNPRFLGPTTGSAPLPLYITNGFGSNPQYPPGFPRQAGRLTMPPSNQSIKVEADPAVGGEGCLFSGPTELVFIDDKIQVRSPQTLSSGPGCGTWPRTTAQTIDIPDNGVIYVQNSTASTAQPNTCGTSSGSTNGLGYPYTSGGRTAKTDDISYGCFNGDAFVEGVVDGRVTVAAENNIAITWHLTRKDRTANSDDIIGLVANNFIQIYHPVSSSGQMNAGPRHSSSYFSNPQVDAAILSVRASFIVPNWDEGAPTSQLGHIHVTGAIAQIFRGPVGLVGGSAGYLKDYVYDQRLTYQSPPHFIDPVEGQWGVVVWTECTAGGCG